MFLKLLAPTAFVCLPSAFSQDMAPVTWGNWVVIAGDSHFAAMRNAASKADRIDVNAEVSGLDHLGECFVQKQSPKVSVTSKVRALFLSKTEWPYAEVDFTWSKIDPLVRKMEHKLFAEQLGLAPLKTITRPHIVDYLGFRSEEEFLTLYIYRLWNGRQGKECRLCMIMEGSTPMNNQIRMVAYKFGEPK